MASYKKLGKNMISLTIGSFASKLLSFFFVPFYTAVLTTEEYGTADLITTTVTLLFPFFSLIICEAMLRFAQREEEDKEKVFWIGIIIWGIGFIVLLCLSPLLRLVPSLKEYWYFVVISYLADTLYTTIGYYVRGIGKVKVYSICGIINTVCIISFNLLFLLVLKIGLIGYLLSFIFAHGIAIVFMIVASKIHLNFTREKFDKNLAKRMLNYSLPMIPNSASWWISNSSDRYILIYYAGVAANGIYSVAYKIPTIISMFTSIFATAWRLSAVEKFGSEESKRFYSDVFNMYITLTICAASGILLINKQLSAFLYSKDFYNAWHFVPVLLLASVFHAYDEFFGTIYTSAMKTKMLFYSTVIGAITNIVLNFMLIPHYEGLGAAIATLVSYATVFLIRLIHSRKILRLTYDVLNDVICATLIIAQMILASTSIQYEFVISLLIFVALIVLRWRSVKSVANMIIKRRR